MISYENNYIFLTMEDYTRARQGFVFSIFNCQISEDDHNEALIFPQLRETHEFSEKCLN